MEKKSLHYRQLQKRVQLAPARLAFNCCSPVLWRRTQWCGLPHEPHAGIALIGLGVSCWPGSAVFQPLNGMLTYSTRAMLYLIVVGVRGEGVGLLLWPAVAAHAILVILLFRIRLKEEKSQAA